MIFLHRILVYPTRKANHVPKKEDNTADKIEIYSVLMIATVARWSEKSCLYPSNVHEPSSDVTDSKSNRSKGKTKNNKATKAKTTGFYLLLYFLPIQPGSRS